MSEFQALIQTEFNFRIFFCLVFASDRLFFYVSHVPKLHLNCVLCVCSMVRYCVCAVKQDYAMHRHTSSIQSQKRMHHAHFSSIVSHVSTFSTTESDKCNIFFHFKTWILLGDISACGMWICEYHSDSGSQIKIRFLSCSAECCTHWSTWNWNGNCQNNTTSCRIEHPNIYRREEEKKNEFFPFRHLSFKATRRLFATDFHSTIDIPAQDRMRWVERQVALSAFRNCFRDFLFLCVVVCTAKVHAKCGEENDSPARHWQTIHQFIDVSGGSGGGDASNDNHQRDNTLLSLQCSHRRFQLFSLYRRRFLQMLEYVVDKMLFIWFYCVFLRAATQSSRSCVSSAKWRRPSSTQTANFDSMKTKRRFRIEFSF